MAGPTKSRSTASGAPEVRNERSALRSLLGLALLGVLSVSGASGGGGDDELVAEAMKAGSVPVIVVLAMDEAVPSPEAIASAQEGLLAELAGFEVTSVKRYTSVPMLALTAGPEALRAIIGSARVESVQRDSLARPTSDGGSALGQ